MLCGIDGTSVPSAKRGIMLGGGATLRVDHASIASHSARCTGSDASGLPNCWQLPFAVHVARIGVLVARDEVEPRQRMPGRSAVPSVFVCISEAVFTQYSFEE